MNSFKPMMLTIAMALSFTLVGCSGGEDHKDHGHKDHKDEGHKDEGHKDEGHKDEGDKDDGHEGEGKALTPADINGYKVEITFFGIEDGEAHLTFTLSGADAAPTAVRAWVGDEAGTGATKAKIALEKKDNAWSKHTHVEVAKDLAAGSKIWVEVETDKSAAAKGFDY